MKISVERLEAHVAMISLDIPPEHANLEYGKACKRASQRVNIPGFRRGKAPRNIIEKNVGVERLKQEALERLLPHAFAEAISEHQLDAVALPQVEEVKFDLSTGIQVRAKLELRPEVTVSDLSDLKVDVPEYQIPSDAEEKELRAIVERLTTLESVVDRAAEATDIVNIDFAGSVNGELIRGGSAKNYRLDLQHNNFIEGFATQIAGHKIGEEFTIQVTFPKEYHDNTLAGKPANFHIKLNDIQKRVVPELNDELARKVGAYANLDELKAAVRKVLDEHASVENDFRKQKALIEAVVERATVDIPDGMINREAKLLMEEVKQRFKSQNASWEQFMDAQGGEAMWENLRQEARKRIKTSLVLGAIAKQEKLAVSDEEFNDGVRAMATMRNVDEKLVVRQLANQPGAAQAFLDQILATKVVDMLMSRTSFNFVSDDMMKEASTPAAAPQPAADAGEEYEVVAEE